MRVKHALVVVTVLAVILAGLLAVTDRKSHAQSNDAGEELIQKVDQIARDQQTILANLAEMKEQLRILTVRVTQQQ